MKFLISLLLATMIMSIPAWSQVTLSGVVSDALTGTPVAQAKVEAASKIAYSGADGRFEINVVQKGQYTLQITIDGYEKASMDVDASKGSTDLGKIKLSPSLTQAESGLTEITLSGESDDKDQAVSGLLHSTSDPFTNVASYTFSSMFFRSRGYDSEYDNVYIEGVAVNDGESGRAVYGEWGGLNDAFRNREHMNGIEPGKFSIGSLGGATNFVVRASKQRKQTKLSYALSNRTYTNRLMLTYSTGLMENNWAFTFTGSKRWGNEGFIEGTFYDGYAYFLGAEKKINSRHSIALTAYASPTRRGMSSAAVQEVYDLLDNNYYNSNWGYQNGEKRNARVRSTNEPMFILSHYFNVSDKTTLTSSAAYTFGTTGTTSLNWFNARDPRPDYYRYLPNYQVDYTVPVDPVISSIIANDWLTNVNTRQLNWDALYQANYLSNLEGKQALYIVENNVNQTNQWNINSRINHATSDNSALSGGIEFTRYKGTHYKVMDDLLGGNYWVDIDQFSQRDFKADTVKLQNDLNNPNRVITEGDKFGYNYELLSNNLNLWVLEQFTFPKYDLYVGGSVSGNQYWRYGNMKNGRDPENSYQKSSVNSSINYTFKLGGTYKISNRQYITANAAYINRPPLLRDAYISPRTSAKLTPGMTDLNIMSGDLSFIVRYPNFNGRITVYETFFKGYSEILRFYDDDLKTFVNMSLTNENKVHQGIEFGAEAKVHSTLRVVGVLALGNYRYTNRPTGTRSYDNGSLPDTTEIIYIKNFYVGGSPQIASSLGLRFNKNYWFVDLNANYYDKIWLDFNPQRRTPKAIAMLGPGDEKIDLITEQTQLEGGFTLDASIGKSIRIDSYFININFSVSNILNNQDLISGGYEQNRIDFNTSGTQVDNPNKFPPKYYYAFGRTFFFNVGFRF